MRVHSYNIYIGAKRVGRILPYLFVNRNKCPPIHLPFFSPSARTIITLLRLCVKIKIGFTLSYACLQGAQWTKTVYCRPDARLRCCSRATNTSTESVVAAVRGIWTACYTGIRARPISRGVIIPHGY